MMSDRARSGYWKDRYRLLRRLHRCARCQRPTQTRSLCKHCMDRQVQINRARLSGKGAKR